MSSPVYCGWRPATFSTAVDFFRFLSVCVSLGRSLCILTLIMKNTNQPTEFIVQTSSATIPGGFGNYRNVAVLEVEQGAHPRMISERARGCVRVVTHYGKCNVGATERSAYYRAVAEAETLADRLNAEQALRLAVPTPADIAAETYEIYDEGLPAEVVADLEDMLSGIQGRGDMSLIEITAAVARDYLRTGGFAMDIEKSDSGLLNFQVTNRADKFAREAAAAAERPAR